MAQVLSSPAAARARAAVAGWWPVDYLIGGYLAAGGLALAIFFRRVPDAGMLLALHAAGLVLMAVAVKAQPAPGSAAQRLQNVFRHWYPLPYVGLCYKEMALLIPPLRGVDYDALAAHLDYRLWGAHPTVWLERAQTPWLTETLQFAYTLFVPCVLLIAAVLWVQRRYPEFRYYAFLVSLGFLASYLGYLAAPVRGPRFFLAHLQHIRLHGMWLFDPMQRVLDRLESAHYDCFPSGHTELTLIAWWSSRKISLKLFAVYSVYTLMIVFATVYLRYHYTIDVFAGIILAAALLAAAPLMYQAAGRRMCKTEEDI
ncbi:MAG: phosphatase PAP2 family protein [Acidobacteriota bacterium]